jgi:hypothetical protein
MISIMPAKTTQPAQTVLPPTSTNGDPGLVWYPDPVLLSDMTTSQSVLTTMADGARLDVTQPG